VIECRVIATESRRLGSTVVGETFRRILRPFVDLDVLVVAHGRGHADGGGRGGRGEVGEEAG
jgi:hypothetical protein